MARAPCRLPYIEYVQKFLRLGKVLGYVIHSPGATLVVPCLLEVEQIIRKSCLLRFSVFQCKYMHVQSQGESSAQNLSVHASHALQARCRSPP